MPGRVMKPRPNTLWPHVTCKEGRVVKIDTGTTAWMLAATALVLLMTPGLAFFYGGMTRAKSVLNMMMMSFGIIITATIAWVIYGPAIAFTTNGNETLNKIFGGLDALGLQSLVDTATKD